ncbi:MAG: DUF3592 domain-containing protein [Pirellulaceae bacterium]|nr:DUF3592 domain-containing protein [Pirellulaceae bacterium]
MRVKNKLFSALFCVLTALPLVFFTFNFYTKSKVKQAKFDQSTRWPSTEGKLLGAIVATGFRPVQDETEPRQYYYPKVGYVYYVDGIQYLGQRYAIEDNWYSTPEAAEAVLNELRQQDSLAVYYDPNSPSESVLKTGGFNAMGSFWLFAACGIAFVGIPLVCTVVKFGSDKGMGVV